MLNGEIEEELDLMPELRQQLELALVDEPPIQLREGGIIRDGFNARLDELREIAKGGRQWMIDYQAKEAERTGISNLKIGFNKVFGYYVEITNAGRQKVPPHYIRKQTIKNAERYITPELKDFEEKVVSS